MKNRELIKQLKSLKESAKTSNRQTTIDKRVYDRMQSIAGLINELEYQGGLRDPYEEPTSYDEQKYEETSKAIDAIFEREGFSLDSPEREKAEEMLQDVLTTYKYVELSNMYDEDQIEQVAERIAETALGL